MGTGNGKFLDFAFSRVVVYNILYLVLSFVLLSPQSFSDVIVLTDVHEGERIEFYITVLCSSTMHAVLHMSYNYLFLRIIPLD